MAWRRANSPRGLSRSCCSASSARRALRAGSCASSRMARAASSRERAWRCSVSPPMAAATETSTTSPASAPRPRRCQRPRDSSRVCARLLFSRNPCTAAKCCTACSAVPPVHSRTQAALGRLRCCQSRARSRLRPRHSSPPSLAWACASSTRRLSSASASASATTQPRRRCHWRIRLSCEMSITGLLASATSVPGTRKAVSARRKRSTTWVTSALAGSLPLPATAPHTRHSWLNSMGRRTSVPSATRSVRARNTRSTMPPSAPSGPSEVLASSACCDSASAAPPVAS